jgi:hypothetical protein
LHSGTQSEKRDSYSVIKELTSANEFIRINKKNIAEYEARNVASVVLFSNERRPMKLANDDRRIFVIDRSGVQFRDAQYYADFADMLKAHWWMISEYAYTLPLTAADKAMLKARAPMTDAKEELIDENRPAWEIELREICDLLTAGSSEGGIKPVATALEIKDWLKTRLGQAVHRLNADIMWGLGIRPVVPDKKRPKVPNVISGVKLYRMVSIWHDVDGVEYNLANVGPVALHKLWKNGRMGKPTFRDVNDDDLSEEV